MNVPISIIIPTMNRCNSLMQTIRFILDGSALPTQLIIVDQSTQDETCSIIRDEIPTLIPSSISYHYIYQSTPSITAARNKGLAETTEDIVLYMDDDVDVKSNTLQSIFTLMADSHVSMIAGIDENTPVTTSKSGYFLGTKSMKYHAIGHVTNSVLGRFPDHEVTEITPTQWAMGFFFVIRKSLIQKWDMTFDEALQSYAYAEDLDFTYRYYRNSIKEYMKCIYSPEIKVIHNSSKEWRISDKKSTYMYILHRAYLQNKLFKNSTFSMNWSNLWIFIFRLIKHDNTKDYISALKFYCTHKTDVLSGNFLYTLW